MNNEIENQKLELRKLKRELLDTQVARMLLLYEKEIVENFGTKKSVDEDAYARKIVAFCREHLVTENV